MVGVAAISASMALGCFVSGDAKSLMMLSTAGPDWVTPARPSDPARLSTLARLIRLSLRLIEWVYRRFWFQGVADANQKSGD